MKRANQAVWLFQEIRKPELERLARQRSINTIGPSTGGTCFRRVAERKHTADYNGYEQWSQAEVQATLNTAHAAFRNWQSIRSDVIAGDYLLMMLLQKQRS